MAVKIRKANKTATPAAQETPPEPEGVEHVEQLADQEPVSTPPATNAAVPEKRNAQGRSWRRADRYADLFALGQERVDIIDYMLVRNSTAAEVARKIQNDWGLLIDKKVESLARTIHRYKKDFIQGKLAATVDDPSWQQRTNGEHVGPIVDAHETLQGLVLTQVKRLNKLYAREEQMPTLMDQVRKESESLHRMVKDLGQMQFDLGYMRRVPKKVAVEMGAADLTGEKLRHSKSKQQHAASNEAARALESVLSGEYDDVDTDVEDGEFTEV